MDRSWNSSSESAVRSNTQLAYVIQVNIWRIDIYEIGIVYLLSGLNCKLIVK